MKKSANFCTIIEGADGPTSVFVAGIDKEAGIRGMKHKIRSWSYRKKREKIKAKITAGAHSIEEVIAYMQEKYHAVEVPKDSEEWRELRKCCKQNLVQKYHPELIGEDLKIEKPDITDEQSVRAFLKQMQAQQDAAAGVPEALFPMDYHIFRITVKNQGEIEFEIEKQHAHFSASSSTVKKGRRKQVQQVVKDIYQYYGVSGQDIAQNSERYMMFVSVLADE